MHHYSLSTGDVNISTISLEQCILPIESTN
jgi:hypothetical protein